MWSYFIMNFMGIMLIILIVMISIAYITLLERKILGLIHKRKGPNKLGLVGLMQPFSDGIKLFSNELIFMNKMNIKMFYLMSLLSVLIMMFMWVNYVYYTNIYFMNYSILIVIMIMSMNSYIGILMGWSSSSMYSMIGSIRLVVQVLSYEVSFIMILLVEMMLGENYVLMDMMKWQYYLWFVWLLLPVVFIFFISVLAELNRSPVDLVEGESELVSGFNVEYFSGSFGLIFMGEYGMIIFMGYLMVFLFLGGGGSEGFNFIGLMFLVFMVIFFRGVLPRMRYDGLMYLCWKIILPLILNYVMWIMFMKILMMYLF